MKIRYFLLCLTIVLLGIIYLEKNNTNNWIFKKNANVNMLKKEKIITKEDSWKETDYEYLSNELNLKSKAACVYDCKGKRLIFGKNAGQKLPMASTTKIMTCIVALEYANLEDKYIVSRYAASMPDVQLNAIKGDEFVLKDLLYSLMLESHNDVAVVIAENIGASILDCKISIEDTQNSKKCVAAFAKLMNKKVKDLGLSNTNFVTPNGLDADTHYTTAYELACISAYAIKNKEFCHIIGTRNYRFNSENGRSYVVSNKNQFLNQYKGAIGCKTGYTSKAGYCFVGAIDREDHKLVSVVLGCGWPPNKSLKWLDTKKLMDYGVKNYKNRDIMLDNKIFNNKRIMVDNGYEKVYISPNIEKKYGLLISDKEKVIIKVKMAKALVAPIKKGQIIGSAQIYIDDFEYKSLPIKANKNIELVTLREKFTELLQLFLFCKVDFKIY